MRLVSERFLTAVRGPHLVVSTVDLLFPGETVPIRVPVESGQVTMDRTAVVRRSGQVQIPWALEAGADLGVDLRTLPFGGWAYVRSGIRYPDAPAELVDVGVYRIESVAWNTVEASAGLELADRMSQVRDEPFVTPFAPPGGGGLTRTGTLTDGSPVVTGLSATGDLLAGQTVSGVGLPAGRRILTINTASQITLDGPANTFARKNANIEPGDPVMRNLSDTSDLSVGMTVARTVGPGDLVPGTIVAAIISGSEVYLSPPPVGVHGGEFDFTAPATATLTFGQGRRIADGAIEIVQQVFGTTIGYRKLHDPAVILDDVFFAQTNRADALLGLAKAAAGECYFDGAGDFIFGPPTGRDAAVWTVDAGETGVLVTANEALDRTNVYNGVLVTGQQSATNAPVSGLAVDDDPTSPTRWAGPYGKVARIEDSSAVQTTGQAADAAEALLERGIGLQRSLTLTAAPNPALEPGDVILVRFPDGREETHVCDVIRLDLGPAGAQELATRTRFPGVTGRRARRGRRVRLFTGQRAHRELVA